MKALALLPAFVLAACAASLPAPLPTGTPTAGFGQTARAGPLLVTPIALVEDSRCPMNARCIWAGRLTVRAEVRAGRTMDVRNVTLGVGQQIADGTLTLTGAQPDKLAGQPTNPADYRFTFAFDGGL